jgi:hypothetical protein
MDIKLSTQDIWFSALIFGVMGGVLALPLAFLYKDVYFKASPVPITLASALFWGFTATLAILGFWELYYKYIFPASLRWLAPLDLFLYAAFGLGMWWLASHLPGRAILWFVLLGGLEGIVEHLFGIYGLRILEKVPWLQGASPLPLVIFSFFEYIFYWTLVGWLGLGLLKFFGFVGSRLY